MSVYQIELRKAFKRWGVFLLSFAACVATAAPLEPPWNGDSSAKASFLVDASSSFSITEVQLRFAQGQGKAHNPETGMPIGGGRTVWFQVNPPAVTSQFDAILTVPRAGLASVDLYSQQTDGAWKIQKSGYNVASADWPRRFLFPVFDTDIFPNSAPMYLAVKNVSASIVPIVWRTPSEFDDLSVKIHMGLAAYSGIILLMVLISLINSVLWRDSLHALYAVYVIVIALAQYAVIGLGGEYLWPRSPYWNSIAAVVGGASFMSIAGIFLWRLTAERGSRLAALVLFAAAAVGAAIVVAFFTLGRGPVMPVYTNYFLTCVALYLIVLIWYSLKNGRVGWWIFAGFLMLSIGSLLILLPTLGFPSFVSVGRYAGPIGAALEIPLVFIGLYMRSRTRHDNRERLHQAMTIDPLTGISSYAVLLNKLDRVLRKSSPAAVLRIRIANAKSIVNMHGRDNLELALVYAGGCIAEQANESDTAARYRDGSFVLLVAGSVSKQNTAEIAQRIVARGLQSTSAFKHDMPLTFQIAYMILPHKVSDSSDVLRLLDAALNKHGSKHTTFVTIAA